MTYMVVEHFHNGDPVPVYRRFHERGRLLPEGLRYVASWVDRELRHCYQLMETEDPSLFATWIAAWSDLAHFEVHPVVTSQEAADQVAPRL